MFPMSRYTTSGPIERERTTLYRRALGKLGKPNDLDCWLVARVNAQLAIRRLAQFRASAREQIAWLAGELEDSRSRLRELRSALDDAQQKHAQLEALRDVDREQHRAELNQAQAMILRLQHSLCSIRATEPGTVFCEDGTIRTGRSEP